MNENLEKKSGPGKLRKIEFFREKSESTFLPQKFLQSLSRHVTRVCFDVQSAQAMLTINLNVGSNSSDFPEPQSRHVGELVVNF